MQVNRTNMDKFRQLKECLLSNRSYRRFDNSRRVDYNTLTEVVDLTRFCSSAMNKQPLRYRIVCEADECAKVFSLLKWAGYLKDWDGPVDSERPVAYIVQCLDTDCMPTLPYCDDGLHLEAITIGLNTLGLGGCIIKAFNAPKLAKVLSLPDNIEPRYVLAIGYPIETVVIDDIINDDCKYWRHENAVHHDPKRTLPEIIIKP
jgi:nitroreductase